VTLPSSTQPKPTAGGQPDAPSQLQLATGLYKTPRDALKSIRDDFSYWTGKVTETSFALSLAVIGANWAVFGSVNKLLNNIWAELSIAAVILSLGISLIGYWYLGGQLRERIAYAEQDAARWRDEFTENAGKATAWPSTERIDSLAARFRFLRTFLPVIGGAFFLIALFTQPKAQKDETHSGSSASPTPVVLSSPPATTPTVRAQPSPR
jgi:hypothetical protein